MTVYYQEESAAWEPTVRDWHIEYDPDGEGLICYGATERNAKEQQQTGHAIHRAADCRRWQSAANRQDAEPPPDPYGTLPFDFPREED